MQKWVQISAVNKVDKKTCRVALCTQQLANDTQLSFFKKTCVNTIETEDGAIEGVETRIIKVICSFNIKMEVKMSFLVLSL